MPVRGEPPHQASLECRLPLWHFTPDEKYLHVAKGLARLLDPPGKLIDFAQE
jgi:hypothetical protein